MTIYKYNLGSAAFRPIKTVVDTKRGKISRVLDIQIQNDEVVLWAEVEHTDTDGHKFEVYSFWTGDDLPINKILIYIGTIQDPKTGLVNHYYIKNIE